MKNKRITSNYCDISIHSRSCFLLSLVFDSTTILHKPEVLWLSIVELHWCTVLISSQGDYSGSDYWGYSDFLSFNFSLVWKYRKTLDFCFPLFPTFAQEYLGVLLPAASSAKISLKPDVGILAQIFVMLVLHRYEVVLVTSMSPCDVRTFCFFKIIWRGWEIFEDHSDQYGRLWFHCFLSD